MSDDRKGRPRSRKQQDFRRELVRSLLVLAVAAAVAVVSRNPKLFGKITDRLGIGSADSGISDNDKKSGGQASDDLLTVEFLDVGQGDCTLVTSGSGEHMLIDTGDRDSENKVIKELKDRDITKLDCLLISHPHADHMGEAAEIIEEFEIGRIIIPDVPDELVPTSQVYEDMLDAVESKGMKLHRAATESFSLGICDIDTYVCEAEDYQSSNLNNYSVAVRLVHGENSFLLTGDSEIEEQNELIKEGAELDSDVLKAAHHGSDTGTTYRWLEKVSPEYAVISCGEDNKYGHPHKAAVDALESVCKEVYMTYECGSVTFTSDGESLTIDTER